MINIINQMVLHSLFRAKLPSLNKITNQGQVNMKLIQASSRTESHLLISPVAPTGQDTRDQAVVIESSILAQPLMILETSMYQATLLSLTLSLRVNLNLMTMASLDLDTTRFQSSLLTYLGMLCQTRMKSSNMFDLLVNYSRFIYIKYVFVNILT
jgi:hypothetical protein